MDGNCPAELQSSQHYHLDPLNESWGVSEIARDPMQQHFTEAIYYMTKSLDPMRPVICNDGWRHTVSDIITLHDYAEDAEEFLSYYLNNCKAMLDNHIPFTIDRCHYAFADGYTITASQSSSVNSAALPLPVTTAAGVMEIKSQPKRILSAVLMRLQPPSTASILLRILLHPGDRRPTGSQRSADTRPPI